MKTLIALAMLALAGCGSLDKQSLQINPGDSKDQVNSAMGAPKDRQFKGAMEAWQYCQTGAGFGYHDHRIIWFNAGKVAGLTSYKSTTPGSMCERSIQMVRWEDAPDTTIELRNR